MYNLNFDTFLIKFDHPDDFIKVEEIFLNVLNYSYIIYYDEVDFTFPLYSSFWVNNKVIYQKDIFEENFLSQFLSNSYSNFHSMIFDQSNLYELECLLKKIKNSFIDPSSRYLPKIIQID